MADTTLYKQIVLEWGQDTDSLIWGMGYSPDNGEHFYVLNTTYGRKYRTEDGDRIWPFIVDKVNAATLNNKLSPDGQFLFNENDGDNMWALIEPKIKQLIKEEVSSQQQEGVGDNNESSHNGSSTGN